MSRQCAAVSTTSGAINAPEHRGVSDSPAQRTRRATSATTASSSGASEPSTTASAWRPLAGEPSGAGDEGAQANNRPNNGPRSPPRPDGMLTPPETPSPPAGSPAAPGDARVGRPTAAPPPHHRAPGHARVRAPDAPRPGPTTP